METVKNFQELHSSSHSVWLISCLTLYVSPHYVSPYLLALFPASLLEQQSRRRLSDVFPCRFLLHTIILSQNRFLLVTLGTTFPRQKACLFEVDFWNATSCVHIPTVPVQQGSAVDLDSVVMTISNLAFSGAAGKQHRKHWCLIQQWPNLQPASPLRNSPVRHRSSKADSVLTLFSKAWNTPKLHI